MVTLNDKYNFPQIFCPLEDESCDKLCWADEFAGLATQNLLSTQNFWR